MSQRSEKNCLNCGAAPLQGRFCHHCGQENIHPRHSIWHLFVHFFNDFWHFEGSFFRTIKTLLLKPGFLSQEYVAGKRKKYLDPIRLYIFVSAVSLFYILSILQYEEFVNIKNEPAFAHAVDSMRAAKANDSFYIDFTDIGKHEAMILVVPPNMREGLAYYKEHLSEHEYAKQTVLERYILPKVVNMYDAYDTNPYNFLPAAINNFMHSLSKIFFISLPLFVLLLYLFFIRRRKQFHGFDHAIFALHYYSLGFLIVTLLITISNIFENSRYTDAIDNLILWLWIGGLYVYLFLAMKRFYRQSVVKTFVKSFFIFSINSIFIAILTAIFFLNSFLTAH